jgi:hypothetical protein
MTKTELKQNLTNNHQAFVDYVNILSTDEFLYAPADKWTAAQQLDHIYKSVKPLTQGMGYPKFVLKWKFGKANRPSRTYDEVVAKYNSKLALGGRATGQFVPAVIGVDKKEMLNKLILDSVQKLNTRLDRFSESEMDTMILPHPLLGKITLREMMYFTMYHVAHHEAIIKRDLSNK